MRSRKTCGEQGALAVADGNFEDLAMVPEAVAGALEAGRQVRARWREGELVGIQIRDELDKGDS